MNIDIRPATHIQPMSRILVSTPILIALVVCCGCSLTMPDRAVRMTRSYVYYLDGAGGGGPIANWSRGVREGLLDAGYDGAGEVFEWQTRLGVVADQMSDVAYKREKAAELAHSIRDYMAEYPGAPVTVMGLSAGTSVAVFALEALPRDVQVENAVLLSSSISAGFDLTEALRRVRSRMYVFTSDRDSVLRFFVPFSGTADRGLDGAQSAGLRGFRLPHPASSETRRQYSKLVHIRWKPEFRSKGHRGEHTDVVKPRFVQAYIAPLIMKSDRRYVQPASIATDGKIRNPDYERWARFEPGSWVMFEGYQKMGDTNQPLRVKVTLMAKFADRLVLERAYEPLGAAQGQAPWGQEFVPTALIDPAEHPSTHPRATVTELRLEQVRIGGRVFACNVKSIQAIGRFPEWGTDIDCKVHLVEGIPGGLARVSLRSRKGDTPFEFRGQVVDFGTAAGQVDAARIGNRSSASAVPTDLARS